jgi:transcriptional antiterminator RfaH
MFATSLNPPYGSSCSPAKAAGPSNDTLQPILDACGLGWFCLRAAGRREHVAAFNLANRSQVEAFAPRIRVRRELRAGGVQAATEALFPGYVFARFRYPEQVRRVVSTTGVLGLVVFGGPPPRVNDTTIAHLRSYAVPGAATALSPVFEEGDWVRVAGGCFRGSEGRVCKSASQIDRVRVLLCLLGQDIEISLPSDQVIARAVPLALTPAKAQPASV